MDASVAIAAADLDLNSLVAAACLAPSSHNTQPWLFRLGDSMVELLADRTRALPVNDPHDRELTISCGCALFNLRVAAATAGFHAHVQLMPDAQEPDLLARVRLVPSTAPPPEARLQPAIDKRRTCRERFAPTALDQEAVQRLGEAAAREGAMLKPLETAEQRLAAASLVAQGDAMQWADPSWRRELAAWMHPRRRGDGLTLPWLAIPVAQRVVRTFDMGKGVAAKDRELADQSPLLAVLATEGDQPRDWLVAGQALQSVLLEGVLLGLQASHLNQPVQVTALRPRLQQLVAGAGCAQLLLRIGTPTRALPAAPRRTQANVLLADSRGEPPYSHSIVAGGFDEMS